MSAASGVPVEERLTSLDAFRGFTIASMVLVNNPGDWGHLYSQLAHAEWNGWTFTDWIFPFFLFVCGVSMTFSLGRRAAAGAHQPALLLQLAKRAAIIFLIGLALNWIPNFDFSTVRIPGVLQRIALCTLLAAPIVVYCGWRGQAAWIAVLLGVYSVLMLYVAVPDAQGRVAAGVLEPGRDFGAYVDRMLLDGHLWARARTWDPEGLVSTLPAICTLLFGALTGRWLQTDREPAVKTVWMLLAGLACLWLGAVLNVVAMPINKSLWTVSFCVFMTGWALIVFSAFFWLVDANPASLQRNRLRKWMLPFTIYGLNALAIFALSGLAAKLLGAVKIAGAGGAQISLGAWLYAPLKSLPLAPESTSLAYAILFNLFMFCIAWAMWRKRWFVKI